MNDHDRVARALQGIFNLSEAQAEAAARGRDGGRSRASSKPVSEAELAKLRPGPANIRS
jgi:hypothetical protein